MSDRHIQTLFVYIISNFRELTLLDNLRELIAKAVNDFIMKVNVNILDSCQIINYMH
jgi:hypothetical protein